MKALLVLVLIAVLSLHLHLVFASGEESTVPVVDGAEVRPIMLEEATLRALVRDEVARALGPSGLTMPDVEAIRGTVTEAVRDGVAGTRIREAVASQYVAAYYDAMAEIERIETAQAEAEENYAAIRSNLRELASAAQRYMLDYGEPEVWFENVVGPSRYIEQVGSVAGENYRSVFPITATTSRLAVRTADGTVVDYSF